MALTVLDVDAGDPGTWAAALVPHRAAGRELLAAFHAQCESAAVGGFRRTGLAALTRSLAVLHGVRGRPRGGELDAVAGALGVEVDALLAANLAYELGQLAAVPPPACSALLRDGPPGPTLARNLDWRFPGDLLRRHTMVVRVRGARAGPYAMIGWPGLIGTFTAIAPGRFALAVNFVRVRRGPLALVTRAAAGAVPVSWALRDALEQDADHAAAVERLSSLPLMAPAILAIASPRRGESCIVERTPSASARRPLAGGELCTANHYLSPRFSGRSVDYDVGGSYERLELVAEGLREERGADPETALRILDRAARDITQHQVVMRPSDGFLLIRVPGAPAEQVAIVA